MKCSYCIQEAQVKCNCALPYMCHTHFGSHILEIGNHPYEAINIDLGHSRLSQLRSNIIRRIKIIDEAKKDLNLKTKSLLKEIEKIHKQVLEQLDAISDTYFNLLKRERFARSEMQTIEKIETMEIFVQNIDIDQIKSEIQQEYKQDLVKYMERLECLKIQFLEKHNQGFCSGCVSRDGKILVTGGKDSTVRVWNLSEKKQEFVLHGHLSQVNCVIITGNLEHVISGSNDASVRIWNLKKKKQIAVLKEHKGIISDIYYIEEKSLIISGSYDHTLIIWDFVNLGLLKKIELSDGVYCLALMKNKSTIIIGLDPDVAFYEIETGNLIKKMKGHSSAIKSISLSNDEKIMVTGSFDKSIKIWDLIESKQIFELDGHSDTVNSVVLTADDKFIVSGSNDYTVRVWDMETGKQIKQFGNHTFFVMKILRINDWFLSLSQDAGIGELDLSSCTFNVNWYLKPINFFNISFSADSMFIGYGSKNEVGIWDIENESCVLIGHKSEVLFVEISRDRRFAISGSLGSENNLIYWNLERNQKIDTLKGHKGAVWCGDFSEDSMIAASGSQDKTVRTWNFRERSQDLEFRGHTDFVFSIKFIEKKKLLVSGSFDKTVIIWKLSDQSQYAILRGHIYKVQKVLSTENGKFVVSGDLYAGIRVWNVDEKKQEYFFKFEAEASNWLFQNNIRFESIKNYLKA